VLVEFGSQQVELNAFHEAEPDLGSKWVQQASVLAEKSVEEFLLLPVEKAQS